MVTLHLIKEDKIFYNHVGFNGSYYFIYTWYDKRKTFKTLKDLFTDIRKNKRGLK